MINEFEPLTAREAQILLAIAAGLSCRDIGTRLSITESTVRKHRSNMLNKLALRNAAELIAYARERHWLSSAEPGPFKSSTFQARTASHGSHRAGPHKQGNRTPVGP